MLYQLYVLLTIPGVVAHELAHSFFCVLAGVKIRKIKLFQFGNTAGYVIHEEPNNFIAAWLITFGPLLVNSTITLFCASQLNHNYLDYYNYLYIWLGFAIGMHAIPSHTDAKSLFQTIKYRFWKNPFIILGYPFVLVLHLLNLLKTLYIDFVYVLTLFWLGSTYFK